jgi:hypothetical protein
MASMPASRFPVAWLRRDGVLDWSATGVARAMLIIRRWLPGTGFMRWSVLHRSVGLGSDRIRMPHAFAGRRIGRGTYDIWLTSGVRPVRCTPERFVFTVT